MMKDIRHDLLLNVSNKQANELDKHFGAHYKQIRSTVMSCCDLKFYGNWEIHTTGTCNSYLWMIKPNFHIPRLIEPKDADKGYYCSETNTISISDWSLEHWDTWETYEVIVHEILHANGYHHRTEIAEKRMFTEVLKCMRILQKKSWRLDRPLFPLMAF